jgi:hypothetical protein
MPPKAYKKSQPSTNLSSSQSTAKEDESQEPNPHHEERMNFTI